MNCPNVVKAVGWGQLGGDAKLPDQKVVGRARSGKEIGFVSMQIWLHFRDCS